MGVAARSGRQGVLDNHRFTENAPGLAHCAPALHSTKPGSGFPRSCHGLQAPGGECRQGLGRMLAGLAGFAIREARRTGATHACPDWRALAPVPASPAPRPAPRPGATDPVTCGGAPIQHRPPDRPPSSPGPGAADGGRRVSSVDDDARRLAGRCSRSQATGDRFGDRKVSRGVRSFRLRDHHGAAGVRGFADGHV